jgi:hypothetical protein
MVARKHHNWGYSPYTTAVRAGTAMKMASKMRSQPVMYLIIRRFMEMKILSLFEKLSYDSLPPEGG